MHQSFSLLLSLLAVLVTGSGCTKQVVADQARAFLCPGDSIINNPAHHAVFTCLIRNSKPADPSQPTTVQLYLSSAGDIYPAAEFLPVDPYDFRWPRDEETTQARTPNSEADLQWYFDRKANRPTRNRLFAQYNLLPPRPTKDPNNYDTLAWDNLRHKMAQSLANELNQATGQGRKTLVVLVHGYNVADYEHTVGSPCGLDSAGKGRKHPYYEDIQQAMLKLRPDLKNAVWLEVHWDGFVGVKKAAVCVWGAAQASARYAGLGLRDVLRRIAPTTPVRIFTHSAGGLVVSQALWNDDAFEGVDRRQKHDSIPYELQISQLMDSIQTPHQADIRVGMLVPALTSQAFVDYLKRTPDDKLPVYRIVVGQNRQDFAVRKGPFGCSTQGATCMGCDAAAFTYAQDALKAHKQELQLVDFCITPVNGGRVPKEFREALGFEKHDWALYFKRYKPGSKPGTPPVAAEFLHKVLD